MIAGDPYQGGATWAVLQYVLGLQQLGHDVYFVEPVAADKVQPRSGPLAATSNAAYFRAVVSQFGLTKRAALLLRDSQETVGLSYPSLVSIAARTDLLINISGLLADPALIDRIPVRLYLDLDPAFNQLWHVSNIDVGFDRHTHFATIGLGLGNAECRIPTCGRDWIATRQPVVLREWPAAGPVMIQAFTTVGNWRGYGSITHDGIFYGQKAHALRQFMTLPGKSRHSFLLAFAIHPDETKDLSRLSAEGWRLVDPARIASTPNQYREFIQASLAEFGIAKSGYATSRCGWFSDRSVCYLASGRPVIALETGFSKFLPTGEGLLAFETEDDVLRAVDAVVCDYAGHAKAARHLAEQYFDATKVLPRLLERTGVTA